MNDYPHPDMTRGQARRDAEPPPECPECGEDNPDLLEYEPPNTIGGWTERPGHFTCLTCDHQWEV